MIRFAENQQQLIDRAKLALNADSFNKLGKELGVNYTTFSRAYKNETFLDEYYITLLCDVTGLDPFQTMVYIRKEEAETKGNEKKVKFWQKHIVAA